MIGFGIGYMYILGSKAVPCSLIGPVDANTITIFTPQVPEFCLIYGNVLPIVRLARPN